MAITFTKNADGSLTVAFTAAAVTWTKSGTTLVPNVGGQHAGGSGAVAAGQLPSWPMDNGTAPYLGSLGLHIFYGTDPTAVIRDYFVNATLTPTNTAGTVTALAHPGGTISYTIPAAAVLDSRAANGIYAQGFVAVSWGPLESGSPVSSSGWSALQLAVSANVLTTQAQPPSAPSALSGSVNGDGSVTLQWSQSSAGTAPLAGYNIKWSTTKGGPYSDGSVFVPISAHPPSNSPTYQTTLAASHFALDGKTRYFVVDAYDNGSTTPSTFSAGTGIVYFPTPPAVVAAKPPAPVIAPGGSGGTKPIRTSGPPVL